MIVTHNTVDKPERISKFKPMKNNVVSNFAYDEHFVYEPTSKHSVISNLGNHSSNTDI